MADKERSRKLFWWLLNITLIVVILIGLLGAKALKAVGKSQIPARTITISSEGRVTAIPDIARVSFSVATEGQNPSLIQNENVQKMNKVLQFVKAQGIPEKDIKTEQYNLSPRYDSDKITGRSFIYGYTLTQSVSLKIRKNDFGKIGTLVSGLSTEGANEISSLSFQVDDPEIYLVEARKEAFEKAYEKAKTMTAQNHVHLGRVITFSEGYGGIPYYSKLSSPAIADGRGGAVPEIQPGSQEVTVQVNVTYELR
jgi:hypothetical protein